MGKKVLIFSILAATVGALLFTVAAGVVVFALTNDNAVQVEEVYHDNVIEVAPLEVEAVRAVNPLLETEDYDYARAGHEDGGCPFAAKAQLTQAEPANELDVVDQQLLTLAE